LYGSILGMLVSGVFSNFFINKMLENFSKKQVNLHEFTQKQKFPKISQFFFSKK
jgi:hypothetical protein